MALFSAILTGLLAGLLHVITGPDHMAAVAPIAANARRRAWTAGLMWGIGHSGGTWTLAAIAIAFRDAINIDQVSAWSERLVGVVLIAVGVWAFKRALRTHIHAHIHEHDGQSHVHMHAHAHPHTPDAHSHHSHSHSALGIGTLHGLAGTSHLLGILPALALPTRTDAITYVIAFGLGSIVAMTAFASLFALLSADTPKGRRRNQAIMIASGFFAILLGAFWIYDSSRHATGATRPPRNEALPPFNDPGA